MSICECFEKNKWNDDKIKTKKPHLRKKIIAVQGQSQQCMNFIWVADTIMYKINVDDYMKYKNN